jgi:hypothetical protein
MTVAELKELLEGFDDNSQILFMAQPNYPFEYSIEPAIVAREDLHDNDSGEPTDIFLLEGSQVRYGDKNAWDNVW